MNTKINYLGWKGVTLAVTASLLISGVASAGTPIAVSLPSDILNPSVPIDTLILKPVNTTNVDQSLNYIAFQGDFTFDERVVSFSFPFVEAAGLTAAGWIMAGNILPGQGPIRTLRVFGYVSDFVTPLSGSGALYNLRMFRVSRTPGAGTMLTWAVDPENFVFIDVDLNTYAVTQEIGLITIAATAAPPAPLGRQRR